MWSTWWVCWRALGPQRDDLHGQNGHRNPPPPPHPPPPHPHPNPTQPPPPPPPLLSLQGLYMGVGLGLGGLVGGYVHKELGARHVFAVAACVVAAAWGLCAAAEVALGVGREEGGGREGEEGEGEG